MSVRDVGSRNGTMVNGEKIEDDYQLKIGDVIDVGPMALELESMTPPKRVGSVAPHVADESLVADSIVDWLKEEKKLMAETISIPSLKPQDTPLRKFNDVADEGADIIRRHYESINGESPIADDDTVDADD